MSSQKYIVLLFYKYVKFENPEKFRDEHYDYCKANNIKGRVFIAYEGINGTVSGLAENIEKYKENLTAYPEFSDLIFKEDLEEEHAFLKIHVRVKKEIVNSGYLPADPANGGKRLKPADLKNFYDSGKEFIIVDARNNYESVIGKFKNALTPDVDNFREWPEVVENLKSYKDKTIVTYCTGGVRCEKASAFMVQQGFKDVYQLDGGILTYAKQYPDTYWEGSVFVFDERRIVSPNSNDNLKHIGNCYYCGNLTSYYINCHNQDCDKIIVTCHDCKEKNDYCCSYECRIAENKRSRYHG